MLVIFIPHDLYNVYLYYVYIRWLIVLKESKLPGANLNLPKENTLDSFVEQTSNKECELKVVSVKLSTVLPVSTEIASTDVAIYEEETRMSADTSSRAQTPAKQVRKMYFVRTDLLVLCNCLIFWKFYILLGYIYV